MTWRTAARCAVLFTMGAGAQGCQESASTVPRMFLGTWTYDNAAQVVGQCSISPDPISFSLARTSFTVRRGTTSDLEMEAGCYCRLQMMVEGQKAVAKGGGQPCEQIRQGRRFHSLVDGVQVEISRNSRGEDVATVQITGQSMFNSLGQEVSCVSFTASGHPTRSTAPAVDCGSEETAVGVLAHSTIEPAADCDSSAGRDAVVLVLDDDSTPDRPFCGHDSGARGEGLWVAPDATKYPPPPCVKQASPETYLGLCRVDGSLFKPLTAEAGRPEQAYALVKIGKRCPDGSVEVKKRIDTEDLVPPEMGNKNAWNGHFPNPDIGTAGNTAATLSFCYFAAAPTGAAVMTDFPDLGLPYAVFHDFEGPQPAWVVSKRWRFSDNQDPSTNYYIPEQPGGLEDIVENTTTGDTYFDMARVR